MPARWRYNEENGDEQGHEEQPAQHPNQRHPCLTTLGGGLLTARTGVHRPTDGLKLRFARLCSADPASGRHSQNRQSCGMSNTPVEENDVR